MDFLFANNASSVLAADITSLDTVLVVSAGSGVRFPSPVMYTSHFTLTLKNPDTEEVEIIYVEDRVDDTMTVLRAQEGTIALSFPANTAVVHTLTAGALEYLRDL